MSQPVLFHITNRRHYTVNGEAKKPLTIIEAQQICADNPNMTWYTCDVCGQLHVGNRRKQP